MFKKILGFAGKKAFDTISNFKPNVGNLKKNQDTMGKLKKITDTYVVKAGKVDPGLKKALRDSGSKSLQKTDKILRKNKKDGGRIGRKLGGGADMAKRKTNVQKIKETFAPKKPGNVPSKFKGFSKLPEAVQQKMNKKLAKKV
jgi:hypothetical protein